MYGHFARDKLRIGADCDEVPGAHFNQCPTVAQSVEGIFQPAPVLAYQPQLFDKLLVGGAAMRKLAYMLQNGVIGKGGKCAAAVLGHYP